MEEDQEDISQFKELREVLTCGICYEILNTPVITACSHTYCSICIRRWLSSKQECPSCAVTIYESSLRKNTIVVNILDAVRNLKKRLFGRKNAVLQSSKSSSSTCPTSAKIEGDDFQPKSTARMTIKSTPPKTPIQNHSAQPKKTPILLPKTPSQKFPRVEVNSTPGGGNPPPLNDQSPGNKVQCPVCNSMMAQSLVNSHLDRCLLEPKTPSSESLKSPTPKINHAAKTSSNSAESNPSLQPIKKKVYNLMSDKQVKTELRKYGLPIQGDRSTLLSRLKRFVILHNAECDSDTPKTLSEIKLHLEKEEKAIASASAASTFSQMFKKTDNPREIESAHQQYRALQKDSYQKLIEDVKKRSKHKPSKKEECIILSETEDDPPPIPVPQHEPVPESAASRRVDTDCDKSRLIANHSNASDSDLDIGKTTSRRKTIKNVKRKCIESESEEDEDLTRQVKQLKQAEESTSPVLSRRTPARQLRSGTARSKAVQKRCILPPQTQTVKRNSQRAKQPPEQVLERGGGEDELSSSSDEEMLTKRSTGVEQVKQRSPTPDMFDSCSPASSILFPCGQKARTDDSGNEALSELVTMIDDDGSTTEYDD